MNKLPERIRIKDIARLANVSVGTVDRVLHGRSGVSEASRKRVEEILKQLDYQPNMYASALASNKKYTFACLLPKHLEGEYWTDVQKGIREAVSTYSDFNISVDITHYDPYDYNSFAATSRAVIEERPDGVMFAPTAIHKRIHRCTERVGYTLYIHRFTNKRCPSPRLLRSELPPKRILCGTYADAACRKRPGDRDFP